MTHIANIVELVGSSDKSWEDAAQVALTEATKTIRGITGIELTDIIARVDKNTGKIAEYHPHLKLPLGWNVPKDLQIKNFQFSLCCFDLRIIVFTLILNLIKCNNFSINLRLTLYPFSYIVDSVLVQEIL